MQAITLQTLFLCLIAFITFSHNYSTLQNAWLGKESSGGAEALQTLENWSLQLLNLSIAFLSTFIICSDDSQKARKRAQSRTGHLNTFGCWAYIADVGIKAFQFGLKIDTLPSWSCSFVKSGLAFFTELDPGVPSTSVAFWEIVGVVRLVACPASMRGISLFTPAKIWAVSGAWAYWSPSWNRSLISLALKKRFCLGSRSTYIEW